MIVLKWKRNHLLLDLIVMQTIQWFEIFHMFREISSEIAHLPFRLHLKFGLIFLLWIFHLSQRSGL